MTFAASLTWLLALRLSRSALYKLIAAKKLRTGTGAVSVQAATAGGPSVPRGGAAIG
jgi:hypothetical protein